MNARLPIAVVIPAYHSEAFLAQALDSVLAQTRLPQEVIVVDDGSPGQATREICEAYGQNVRYLHKDNGGPASARNLGASECEAPWLAFLDADDLWVPDKLERQWAALEARPEATLVCSEAWLLVGDQRGDLRRGGRAQDLSLAQLLRANPIVTSSVVVAREAFEQAEGFCEDRELIAVEDFDLWLRLAALGELLWLCDPLVQYRVHEASLSGAQRFHKAVSLVLDRADARLPANPEIQRAIRFHRATLEVDLAWELLEKGEVREALRPIFHSLTLTPLSWRSWKLIPKAFSGLVRGS